jgi:hypothetical protein
LSVFPQSIMGKSDSKQMEFVRHPGTWLVVMVEIWGRGWELRKIAFCTENCHILLDLQILKFWYISCLFSFFSHLPHQFHFSSILNAWSRVSIFSRLEKKKF